MKTKGINGPWQYLTMIILYLLTSIKFCFEQIILTLLTSAGKKQQILLLVKVASSVKYEPALTGEAKGLDWQTYLVLGSPIQRQTHCKPTWLAGTMCSWTLGECIPRSMWPACAQHVLLHTAFVFLSDIAGRLPKKEEYCFQ